MDVFKVTAFRYKVRKGKGPKTWDYKIVGSPDEAHDIYLVYGHFFLEIV